MRSGSLILVTLLLVSVPGIAGAAVTLDPNAPPPADPTELNNSLRASAAAAVANSKMQYVAPAAKAAPAATAVTTAPAPTVTTPSTPNTAPSGAAVQSRPAISPSASAVTSTVTSPVAGHSFTVQRPEPAAAAAPRTTAAALPGAVTKPAAAHGEFLPGNVVKK